MAASRNETGVSLEREYRLTLRDPIRESEGKLIFFSSLE
jgi:hypothetical protein